MYRHTLKRFTVEREKDEDFDHFIDRAETEANIQKNKIGQDLLLSTSTYMSFISDKQIPSKNGCLKNTIISAVIEVNEIPQEVQTEGVKLLLYHDEVKQEEDGKIKDIDYDKAAEYVQETIIQLRSVLTHIEVIGDENEDHY